MRKTAISFILLVLSCCTVLSTHAQTTIKLPAKEYPLPIPHKTAAGVDRYWHITQILCLGPSSSGYKFRIYGKARKTSSSCLIDLMYMLPGNKVKVAGTYSFPAIEENKPFNFDIVSAFKGYAPSSFMGFFIYDEILEYALNEEKNTTATQETEEQATTTSEAQIQETEEEDNNIYETAEQMPEYPGGTSALMSYLGNNIRYPTIAIESGIQGTVYVTFCVEKDGSITNVTVSKSLDYYLDREAIRVVSSMPKWTPGKQKGKPVRTKFSVPVNFRLK